MIAGLIFFAISAMLFIFAYLLYYKEAYWLISGINFQSREQAQEQYDLRGLTRLCGIMCALIGLSLLLAGIAAFMEMELLLLISLGAVFFIVPIFMFRTERYMRVGKKSQRIVNLFVTALLAAVAVFVIAMMVTGSKSPEIFIEKGDLIIESSYGTKLPLNEIEQIDMVDLEGREISKQNGFNMGNNLKGYFRIEGIGKVMLYQQGEPGDTILIKSREKKILINIGSEAENEKLKQYIENEWKQQQ